MYDLPEMTGNEIYSHSAQLRLKIFEHFTIHMHITLTGAVALVIGSMFLFNLSQPLVIGTISLYVWEQANI